MSNPDEFEKLTKQFEIILKEHGLLMIASFSVTLELTTTEFNVTQYVEPFDFCYVYFDTLNDITTNNFAHALNEIKPSTVEKKLTNLIKWGIPRSKLVCKICLYI